MSSTEVVLLKVDKSRLNATLMTWPEKPETARQLRTFTIAVGKAKGDKQREGDNRTPEGIYLTQRIIDGSQLPAKYGPKAIPINFPNPVDQKLRISGYGIWLHGVENNSRVEEANVTEGCVAFYNQDIVKLARWLQPHQGIVVIAENEKDINRKAEVETVRAATESWIEAWQQGNLEQYASFYDPSFSYRRMNRAQYKTYKKRVFKSYRKMKVSIDNLRVITHPKYAVAIMNQDFNGDNRFISNGRKLLYWGRSEGGGWKILAEIFDELRVRPVEISEELLATLAVSESAPKSSQSAAKPQSKL
jgi:murein L,D-transpeptidase YafK